MQLDIVRRPSQMDAGWIGIDQVFNIVDFVGDVEFPKFIVDFKRATLMVRGRLNRCCAARNETKE